MICELCGEPIIGKPIRAWIEGAQLTVCHRCSRYGSTVKSATQRVTTHKPSKHREVRLELESMVLVDNYNTLIRQARESMGLTQEDLARLIGEKESVVRRLESGRMVPTLELAKKLERILKIKLYEELRQEQEVPRPRIFELTLGDVAIIRDRQPSNH
ncbi:MAG: multiprotein bridging factor aMBF1 [Candidatus Nezhaarchaeota archaeon]|nr:multiprotein bridging factor aMBF1 [Candidatus Nezhaarchaeota archaeon]